MKAYQHLEAAERLNKAKNEEYGDGHLRHGQAMSALFPDGLSLFTSDDFARFAVFDLMMVKMVRYAADFSKPHRDSIKDLMVYAAMLEELHDQGDGDRGGTGVRVGPNKAFDAFGSGSTLTGIKIHGEGE